MEFVTILVNGDIVYAQTWETQRIPSSHLKEMSGDQFGEFACGYWA